MRKNKTIFLVIFLIFLSAQFFSQTDNPKMVDQEELELILKKSAEYCEKLSNSVLDFICREIITENIDYGPPSFHLERNIYIYDYQLKRQGNSIDEQRILVEENGQKKNKANAQLKTKRFRHEHVVFGPIGLLGQKQQEIYEYKILEEVPYKGEKAVVLEATPIFPNEANVLYGKIWIRKKDFNILKIEWNQESLENFEGVLKIAKRLRAKPRITFVSEYAFEKNGIRFPSKYSVEEIYIRPRGAKLNRSKTTVIYDNYKFFSVETKVKYKKEERR